MGYESKIFITEDLSTIDGLTYLEAIAMVDMCAVDKPFLALFNQSTDNLRICFPGLNPANDPDEGEMPTLDQYDAPLTESTVEKVLKWLEIKCLEDNPYRRYITLRDTLRSFQANWNSWKHLRICHYGY